MELGKWIEITSCSVLLANSGELPAEGYTVETEIANIKGIQKRNEIIPPGGEMESSIFSIAGGEWYQDGKKLSMDEFPKLPINAYDVMVKIKNDHGKAVTSRKFNCSFSTEYEESRCAAVN